MFGNQAKACTILSLLVPGEKSDTTAATGEWVDVSEYEGDIAIICSVGTVTDGSITPTIRTASDDGGTGDSLLTLNEGAFTVITSDNDPNIEKLTVDARSHLGFIQFVGTIVTGPVEVAAMVLGHKKYM
jgi:hypothetical protein